MRVNLFLTFLFLAVACFAKGVKQELKVTWGGHTYLLNPDFDCWSEHEIAQTLSWPRPTWVVGHKTNSFDGAQMRVRGQSGDRTNRNYLVRNIKTGKLIRPAEKYFRRADPFAMSLPMPPAPRAPPNLVRQSDTLPPAPVTKSWTWQACDDITSYFNFYTSQDLVHWTRILTSNAPYLEIQCDKTGPVFFGIKAVSAEGIESGWGGRGPCQ